MPSLELVIGRLGFSQIAASREHSLERDNDDEKQEEIQDFGKPLYISQN